MIITIFILTIITGASIAVAFSYYVDNKNLKRQLNRWDKELRRTRQSHKILEDERVQLMADLSGWSENGVLMNSHILHLEQELRVERRKSK